MGIASAIRSGNSRKMISLFVSLAALALCASSVGAAWYDLGGGQPEITTTGTIGGTTRIEMTLGGFETRPVLINGEIYHHITIDKGGHQEEAGLPDLPDVRCSLIIANDKDIAVRFIGGEYVDLPAYPIAPAKGPISRQVDPLTVPYTFADLYDGTEAFPPVLAESHDPYILRDYRGAVIALNAFQYFPDSRTLRVYTQMTVEVTTLATGSLNLNSNHNQSDKIDSQFATIYDHHFTNYARSRYSPVQEEGGLLIITPDMWVEQAVTLADWKNQKGIPTEIATLTDTGNSDTDIKNYIQARYDAGGLTYVLLFGDAQQLPPMNLDSDPSYALLAGFDPYPDIFVGRFSAETTAQLETQINRTITYERDLDPTDTWLESGFGIASNLPGGHNGETDGEHMNIIRNKLLGYTYVGIDSLYGIDITAEMVAEQLNVGRGITNYIGHGQFNYWSTSHFSSDNINELVNENRLPFIHSAACFNGDFMNQTCFAESWLRATYLGQPTGAIATYMSVISQNWIPPMDAQDETIDLLVGDQMRTTGGLWYNGSCRMIDLNFSQGPIEFKGWTIFGDPSLAIRTQTPADMIVVHPNTIMLDQLTCDIEVTGVDGALCALSANGEIYGSSYTDEFGLASIPLTVTPLEPMALTLTVTAYNKTTWSTVIIALAETGPYLAFSEIEYLLDGDVTTFIQAGQTIQMRVKLDNVGFDEATSISSSFASTSSEIALAQPTSTYVDILPTGSAWNDQLFTIEIDPECPDEYAGELTLNTSASGLYLFESEVSFKVHAPIMSIWQMVVTDTITGDANYHLDPGESGTISFMLFNEGSGRLDDIEGVISCDDPLIQITPVTGTHSGLGEDETGQLSPLFEVSVDPFFPDSEVLCTLTLTGSNQYARDFDFILPIGGFVEDIENSAPNWSHYPVTPLYMDQWHVSDQRNHTPDGMRSWKCGGVGEEHYFPMLDAGLETPPVLIHGNGELRFSMWMNVHTSSIRNQAFDGGLVEMSVDGGPFEQIIPLNGYSHIVRLGDVSGPFAPGTPVFSGLIEWQDVIFELGDTVGEVVFRFRFGTDESIAEEGWYIDDLEVLGTTNLSGTDDWHYKPVVLNLSAALPNPFSTENMIRFDLPSEAATKLQVYDLSGRLVKTIIDGTLTAGSFQYSWDGRDNSSFPVAGGIYYYRLNNGLEERVRSVVLIR